MKLENYPVKQNLKMGKQQNIENDNKELIIQYKIIEFNNYLLKFN